MILNFIQFFSENPSANRIAPDGTPRSAASHLGLCCLTMSHKRDARLKCVNVHFEIRTSKFKVFTYMPPALVSFVTRRLS